MSRKYLVYSIHGGSAWLCVLVSQIINEQRAEKNVRKVNLSEHVHYKLEKHHLEGPAGKQRINMEAVFHVYVKRVYKDLGLLY